MKTKSDFPSINAREPAGVRPNGVPYKILVVDDSMFVKKQLSQIIASEGFEIIDTAADGIEGLEKYKEHHPHVDAVTMDITMPNMDGISCLEKIIAFDKNAKVIMVTALGKQDLVKKSFLMGAKDYIVKPLDRKVVINKLVKMVKGS